MQSKLSILAIDLAKDVFQLYGVDARGKCIFSKKVRRDELLRVTASLPACVVAMEACGGSHYWSRRFKEQGHATRIIAAKFVKAFRRSAQKNDVNDAMAIAEAAGRPQLKLVATKSLHCQDLQSLHRVRQQLVKTRTSFINQCRGLAMEYGVVLPEGRHIFIKEFSRVLEEDSELTIVARDLLASQKAMIDRLSLEIEQVEKRLHQLSRQNADYQRILEVPGVGPMTASLLLGSTGDVSVFKNGRHLAAWLGLVPRQHSTGGQTKLLGITKAGSPDLRAMMIHGARSLITATIKKRGEDPLSQWILRLLERKGWNVTAVAVANRNCRVIWHLLKYKEEYKKPA